jgi:excinuclease ABC subunit A
VQINYIDLEGDEAWQSYSEKLSCPNNHPVQLTEIEPRTFSFNAPFGACPECSGLGTRMSVDADLLLGDPDLSIAEGVVLPWTTQGKGLFQYYEKLLAGLARDLDFSLDTPWGDLSGEVQNAVLRGDNFEVRVKWKNRYGREMSYTLWGVGALHRTPYAQAETDTQRQRWPSTCACARQVCNGTGSSPRLGVQIHARALANKLELIERERPSPPRLRRSRCASTPDPGRPQLPNLAARRRPVRGEAQRIRSATRSAPAHRRAHALDEPGIGTSGTTAYRPRRPARPRQHADRGRTRRGHHPHAD